MWNRPVVLQFRIVSWKEPWNAGTFMAEISEDAQVKTLIENPLDFSDPN
jgi:hypothetical protein